MPLSGRKVKSPDRKRERERRERGENNTINNGHYVGSTVARTPLGPIITTIIRKKLLSLNIMLLKNLYN